MDTLPANQNIRYGYYRKTTGGLNESLLKKAFCRRGLPHFFTNITSEIAVSGDSTGSVLL
jgi:hypothetical protein